MENYTIINSNVIQRHSDGAYIPIDQGNTDYQKYLKWIAEGNTAQTLSTPPII